MYCTQSYHIMISQSEDQSAIKTNLFESQTAHFNANWYGMKWNPLLMPRFACPKVSLNRKLSNFALYIACCTCF